MASAAIQAASSQKLTATARCARRSASGDWMRDPVNRHTTMTLAAPSMALPAAHPLSATDPAATPAARPKPASASIHTSDTQASHRA
jgi:hypothetical protein